MQSGVVFVPWCIVVEQFVVSLGVYLYLGALAWNTFVLPIFLYNFEPLVARVVKHTPG